MKATGPRFGKTGDAERPHAPDGDALIRAYENRDASFIALPPSEVLSLPDEQILSILEKRLGKETLARALDPAQTIESPLAKAGFTDSSWLGKSHVVGAHPRALGSFWNIVKYALTLSDAQNAIHLLPVFEHQLNGLYLQNSWRIEPEFFDKNLARLHPVLDSPEKQLKASINLLHALNKSVGFDILRNSAHYSETVMAHPDYFMWVKLSPDLKSIERQDNDVHQEAQAVIGGFLKDYGDASAIAPEPLNALENRLARDGAWTAGPSEWTGPPPSPSFDLWAKSLEAHDEDRLSRLLGPETHPNLRLARRVALLYRLKDARLFPIPVVDGPPFRPLSLDKVREDGWPAFRVGHLDQRDLGGYSHIFGNITPFKLYELDPQGKFQIHKPLPAVWNYLNAQLVRLQKAFNFDFMRGDMAHLDYRGQAAGAEAAAPEQDYDMFPAMKRAVQSQNRAPWFAFLPESMFHQKPDAPDTLQHTLQMQSDLALSNLQHHRFETGAFPHHIRHRENIRQKTGLAMANGMMTADSDTASNRERSAQPLENTARAFIGFFLPPSYMGMGFEMKGEAPSRRSQAPEPASFTHPFNNGLKGQLYRWNDGLETFHAITRIKRRLDAENQSLLRAFQSGTTQLLDPNAANNPVLSWTLKPDGERPEFLFVLNTQTRHPQRHVVIPTGDALDHAPSSPSFHLDFSTDARMNARQARIQRRGKTLIISSLAPGEGRIYRIATAEQATPAKAA